MADVELPRRTVGSSTRLTPEEIVNRGFATAFRGISETEVRNFLKRIADEFAALRDRERELAARVEQLEDRLRNPPPPTEQQLLDSLGEETARVLRSAQEAADDIRRKAEERAAALQQESQDEAERLRETTESQCGALRREAEDAVAQRRAEVEAELAELRAQAESEIAASREDATREAEAGREAARSQGREMVAEAFAVRERVVTDLSRRRARLQAQVDALRTRRDALLEAYRVVHRTVVEAADALTNAETAELEPTPVADGDEPDALAADTTAVDSAVFEAVARVGDAHTASPPDAADETPRAAAADQPISRERERDVDALFARLRAERDD
ncbi:MAG: DivIVA domain-containing protein, partial [Actinobacteria bacterium]|nr:DivIVA domain-containing protein [Actinomycetota bacterium]